MSVFPLPTGRVSTLQQSKAVVATINHTQLQLQNVENEISTGKQVNVPSDNPSAAAIIQQLQKTLDNRQAYTANLQQANSQLGESSSTLTNITTLLQQAQNLASANIGSTASADQRSAAADQIQGIQNQILSLANTSFGGLYIFSGGGGQQQPFVQSAVGGVQFVGSDGALSNAVDDNTTAAFMVDGAGLFGAESQPAGAGAALTPELTASTRLADLAGAAGAGVQAGSIQINNGTVTATVDLSHADTAGDVVNAIDAAGIPGVTASFSGGNFQIDGGGNPVTISETGGTTAAGLGILGSSPAGTPLVGQDVGVKVTGLTTIASLRNGAGIDPTGLTITNGSKTNVIDFSSANNVQDMLNSINGANLGISARISPDGSGIQILNMTQGANLTIGENGGTTAAELGVRTLSVTTPLANLNDGTGVNIIAGSPDFQVTRKDGTSFSVDLSGAATIQDVIDDINTADGGGGVTASFASTGNGIILNDSTGGGGTLNVSPLGGSTAAADLGIDGAAAGSTLTGKDTNPVVAGGIFTHLTQLQNALRSGDTRSMTQSAQSLQKDYQHVADINGQTGAQMQEVQSRQSQIQDQNLATQSLLSQLQDTDMTSAITQFQQLQTNMQASLATAARTMNLSLLDFLG